MTESGTTRPAQKRGERMNYFEQLKAGAFNGGGSSPSPSPFPDDCPFTCNQANFLDSEKEWTIGSTTYNKYNDDYAVGITAKLNAGGTWTAPILFSPVSENAIKYYVGSSLEGTLGGTVTLDGVSWYYSIAYGQSGEQTVDGLPVSQYVFDYPFTDAQLLAFLAEAGAENRSTS